MSKRGGLLGGRVLAVEAFPVEMSEGAVEWMNCQYP
jgi:hypothetical protein